MNVGVKLAGLVDDREAVNEEKKSVQHVSLYRIGQEFVRQWYVVIEEVCSAEHMHRMGDTRLCSPCPPLSAACSRRSCCEAFVLFTVFSYQVQKLRKRIENILFRVLQGTENYFFRDMKRYDCTVKRTW